MELGSVRFNLVHPWLMMKGGGSMEIRKRTDGWQGCTGMKIDWCQEDRRVKKVELRWTWYSCVSGHINIAAPSMKCYDLYHFPINKQYSIVFQLDYVSVELTSGLTFGWSTEPTSRRRKFLSLVAARRLLTPEPVLVSLVQQPTLIYLQSTSTSNLLQLLLQQWWLQIK